MKFRVVGCILMAVFTNLSKANWEYCLDFWDTSRLVKALGERFPKMDISDVQNKNRKMAFECWKGCLKFVDKLKELPSKDRPLESLSPEELEEEKLKARV